MIKHRCLNKWFLKASIVVIPCHYGYLFPPVRSQGAHPAEFVTAIAARNYMLGNTDIVILSPGGKYVLV